MAAGAFVLICGLWSWWRWWSYQLGTFDLAFYVQGLWLAIRGQWNVSLLEVPILGNHAEPIVFLLAPLFAVCPHPMVLVGTQAIALASSAVLAWRICQRLGFPRDVALPLSLTVLLTPATGFIAVHEFHPEAFALPLLLAMADARLAEKRGRFYVWSLLAIACKENVAMLVVAWCVVFAVIDRRKGWPWQLHWNAIPGVIALTWVLIYGAVLSPALNAGNVDYAALYSHLGSNPREIVTSLITRPLNTVEVLYRAVSKGDLVWMLVLPLFGLPLLRPRWWLIAAPVLGQHLLSWRPSEWSIHFHYAAPLVPLVWLAAVETLQKLPHQKRIAWACVAACLVLQVWRGPASVAATELAAVPELLWQRTWKAPEIERLQKDPALSVTAGFPYLSHLATRSELRSLHHVLKGLRTLSGKRLEPSVTDVFFIDFADSWTFNLEAGRYHPTMRTRTGEIIPSSDHLLHETLLRRHWDLRRVNHLAIFRQAGSDSQPATSDGGPSTATATAWQNKPTNPRSLTWKARAVPGNRSFAWAGFAVKSPSFSTFIPLGPIGLGFADEQVEQAELLFPPDQSTTGATGVWIEYAPPSRPGERVPPVDLSRATKVLPLVAE